MTSNLNHPVNAAIGQMDGDVSKAVRWLARQHPFAIAAIAERTAVNFATLNTLVGKAAGRLRQAGLEGGAIAGFRFEDQFLHLVFVLAALRSGIAHVSIFRGWPDRLGNDFTGQTGAEIIFGDAAWPAGNAPIRSLNLSSLAGDSEPAYDSPAKASGEGPILFVLGSGTTGNPRIIHYDSANLAAMIARDLKVRPIGFQERYYSMIAFDFFTGKRRALGCLASGGTVILNNKAPSIAAMCDHLAVDHLALVVNHAEFMVDNFKTGAPRLPRLKSLVIGGSPISEDLRLRLRTRISPNLFIGYGTNEIGEAAFASPTVQLAYPGTVGMPSPGVEIRIASSRGKALPPRETGDVLLRAKGIFSGYLNEPEATAKAFDGDWYRPGDHGYLTPDGALVFKGRSDDMMIFDGISIYPREIEQVLESHSGVLEAAAFPLRSAKRWQIPVAAVTLREASLSAKELRGFCIERLGPKAPVHVWIVERMPRNQAGKILKRDLAKRARNELSQ